jgi:hypothetical protein
LCGNAAGEHGRDRADECTGNETLSHCFTPLALVLNRFLANPEEPRDVATITCRPRVESLVSAKTIACRSPPCKEKPVVEALWRTSVAAMQRRDKITRFQ